MGRFNGGQCETSVIEADGDFDPGSWIGSVASPGITLGSVSNNTNESGTTATFTAVLNAAPTSDVVLDIGSSDTGEVTVNPSQLTFTTGNWNSTQLITLNGVDDSEVDGDINVTITVAVNDDISDDDYDGISTVTTVTNENDEIPPVPSLIITEVADPDDQYKGRFVEIYNNGATDINLATEQIYIAIQANGGSVSSKALSGTLAANEVMIIGNSSNINTYYGFSADEDYGTITGNGDDGYFLYHGGNHSSGTLFDSYGVLGQDGSGQTWFYEDTRAYRNSPKSASPNTTWTLAEWTVQSTDKNLIDMTPGALEDEFRYDGDWKPRDVYTNSSATDDVYISSTVTLSANLSVTNFEIETNQIATINSGGSLIVSGTSSGNITYNRNLANTDWYLVSSPVMGQDIDTFVSAEGLASGTNNNNMGLASYDNTSAAWSYHQSDASVSGDFALGSGRSIKLAAAGDISFTGTMPVENVSIAITSNTNGYNLVGNPYPSYIAANTVAIVLINITVNTSILTEGTLWFWNQATRILMMLLTKHSSSMIFSSTRVLCEN